MINKKIIYFVVFILLASLVYAPPKEEQAKEARHNTVINKLKSEYPSFYDIQDPNSLYEYHPYQYKTYIKNKIDSTLSSESYIFYDKLGRTEQTQQLDSNGNAIVSNIRYNKIGLQNLTDRPFSASFNTLNDLGPVKTTYTYDALGRAKKTIFPDGNYIEITYGPNWVLVRDENNNYRKSTNDAFGRLIMVEENSDDGINFNGTFRYYYDTNGNLINITDAKGHTTTNEYNSLNQLTKTTHPDTGTTLFEYDKVGNLEWKTDARGVEIYYNYDELNRLRGIRYHPLDDVVRTKQEIEKFYDRKCIENNVYPKGKVKGKLCYVEDDSGTMQFEYDEKGRVITEIKTIKAFDAEKIYIISYSYDDADNIKLINLTHDGKQEIIEYHYNKLNQLERITFNGNEIASYTYKFSGTIEKLNFAGTESDIRYSYTTRDWLETLDAGPTIFQRRYGYDAVGNIEKLSNFSKELASFEYDPLDRLTHVEDNEYYRETIDFIYDATGNREARKSTLGDIAYTYKPGTNQMETAGNCNYTYDANGNTETKICGNDTTTYYYDSENRLSAVVFPDKTTNNYVYDMNGLRAAKLDSEGEITFYVYDMAGNNIFEEKVEATEQGWLETFLAWLGSLFS